MNPQRSSELLPGALDRAVRNYRHIAFAQPPDDARAFQQHQAACKAALQHIEVLIKLADVEEKKGTDDDRSQESGRNTEQLLSRAADAYAAYVKRMEKNGS